MSEQKKFRRGHEPAEAYVVSGVPLSQIKNRNEIRVINLLPDILSEFIGFVPDSLDIQDIYALALNNLPPRYVQSSTVILQEPVSDEEIKRELRRAVEQVEKNPNK